MSALAILCLAGIAWFALEAWTSPEGWEDAEGFHYGREPGE